MKIGIVCYPTSGGSGVVASDLGAALAAKGHDVHFITYAVPFRLRPRAESFRVHLVEIPTYPLFEYPSYGMAVACRLAEVHEEYGLDVVHTHYAYPHAVSAHLARQIAGADFRIVTTLHGTDIALVREDASFRRLTRFALKESDAVTSVSSFLRDQTLRWFDLDKPIEVIPNFVDPAVFRPRPAADPPEIVHVSNFRPVKRSADAIRAFCLLRSRLRSRLVMLGEGPERAAVEKLAGKMGVRDDVEFVGESHEVAERIGRASLLVTTSEFEGFGLAPLEAMACGVPVAGTRAGGIPEVVGDAGRLVDVGDVEALAGAMEEVLRERDRYSRAASRRAERFRPGPVVEKYEEIYRAKNLSVSRHAI